MVDAQAEEYVVEDSTVTQKTYLYTDVIRAPAMGDRI
jgi:hypothetical protein